MNKLLIIIMLGLLLVGSISFVYNSNDDIEEEPINKQEFYQGPVPEGYDLEHFRNTGETIKEEAN